MTTTLDPREAFHRGTAPIFALLSDEQLQKLSGLGVDSALQSRIAELFARSNEGELSEAERAEYEAYIEADNLLAILQAEARLRLQATE